MKKIPIEQKRHRHTDMNTTSYPKLLVFLATAFILMGCFEEGITTAGGTGTGTTTTTTTTTTGALRLGSGIGTGFTESALEIKVSTVSVNGSTAVSVYIVDSNGNLSKTSNTVTFESACSIQGLAGFTLTSVTTLTGIATTTYLDQGCAVSDTVVAIASWDSAVTATGDIIIDDTAPITVGSVRIGNGSSTVPPFVNGVAAIATPNILSNGSTLVTVSLVDVLDDLLTTTYTVNFSSDCQKLGAANFTIPAVTTSTGTASATYNPTGCVGDDVISATVTIGTTDIVATGTVTVAAASAGSIQFTSATPSLIALKGTGSTTGLPENSTVTFTVLDNTGAVKPGAVVTFTLNSTLGGITLSTLSATSDDIGVVTTTLQSGSVATSVRISAAVSTTTLVTNSDAIAIATGPPDQNSMSLSAFTLNPRAWDIDGKTVQITARLADRFNNPIQDGTAVLFTTELGAIGSTCTTSNGACSVDWTSSSPRGTTANAGRTTILATVVGEESFVDLNANGIFDGTDTFTDLGEAYLDENENGVWDATEPFTDFNGNNVWDAPDTQYSGSGCAINCATLNSITVRDSLVLVMSEDTPAIFEMGTNGFTNNLCFDFASCVTYRFSGASLNTDVVGSLSVTLAGVSNGQVLPAATTVDFTASNGKITSGTTHTIGNTTGLYTFSVFLTADTTPSNDGSLNMQVTIGDNGLIFNSQLASIDDTGNVVVPTTNLLGTGHSLDLPFTDGAMILSAPSLAAGGTTSVSVNLVDPGNGDALVTTSSTITFTSNCVSNGFASFDTASYSTVTGEAIVNYTSTTCSGVDRITATNGTATASADVTIAAPTAGSIQFTSVSSSLIALKGTGTTSGNPETSAIMFTVVDSLNTPIANETVNFSLDSEVGGLSLVSLTANTNASGQVTATVLSGTVATSVRVTANVDLTALATTSSAIVIATGPPDQDSISLSASELNPRGWNYDGTEVTITARLADRFNNKIQDGTAVSFTAELGSIQPSCTTIDGACSVIWTSQNPRVGTGDAGRSTISATVEGEESFIDVDGNGVFSDGDGTITNVTDLPEAFRDDDENGTYTSGEPFIDFDISGSWTDVSTTYNGAGCTHATLCDTTSSISVRDSLVLVMAEDTPAIIAIGINGYDTDGVDAATCFANPAVAFVPPASPTPGCICVDGCDDIVPGSIYPASFDVLTTVSSITYTIAGFINQQVLPVGTSISFSAANGTILAGGSHTVANTNSNPTTGTGSTKYTIYFAADTTPSADGVLNLTVGSRGFAPVLITDN